VINIFIVEENKIKYYQSYEHYPSIPKDIEEECIHCVEKYLTDITVPTLSYTGYDHKNIKSLSYVSSEVAVKKTGTIGFYFLPSNIIDRIIDHYTKLDHPLKGLKRWAIQYAIGDHIAPHIDDPPTRHPSLLYLIKAGGSNVRTKWYKIKDEFKNHEVHYNIGIPYDRLILVEDQCLKESSWHWMNFNEPHSVENQESLRIALWSEDCNETMLIK
jgi:hypothetical protein